MRETDALILGAGPAGTAAAYACCRAGLRTVIVERAIFPRHRPGETLHPGIESLLRQMGVWDALGAGDWLRHTGHWTRQGSENRFEAFGSEAGETWRGFQVERAAFDALLLREAERAGAEIIQPCRLVKPLCHNGRVVGVDTSAGALRARFVVDATGGTRWLARHLGLSAPACSPVLRARYGYAEGECAERNDAPLWEGNASGWTWLARIRPGAYHWTRLWFDAEEERRTPRSWQPAAFASLAPSARTRGVDVTWRMADAPAGAGYFLAGDAAFVLDPAASHGVMKALMSGMMTAHAITKIARGEISEAGAQTAYTLWLRRWFTGDAARLRAVYASLRAALAEAGAAARQG